MEKLSVSRVRELRKNSAMGAVFKDMHNLELRDGRTDAGYLIDRNADDYEELLPRFQGKTFVDHLVRRIKTADSPVSVLDIGCGRAKFLRELKEEYPGIDVSGISVTDLREKEEDGQKICWEGIDYRVADMHRLEKEYGDKKFDFVISVWALFHSGDPLDVVKQSYQLLKPGGVAFLQSPDISISRQERDRLISYWASCGITVELHGGLDEMVQNGKHTIEDIYDISFRRSKAPKMPMPFSYIVSDKFPQVNNMYVLNLK